MSVNLVDAQQPTPWVDPNLEIQKLPLDKRVAAARDYLAENGHTLITITESGRWVAVYNFLFTCAILEGHIDDLTTYSNRWCYSSFDKTVDSLNQWLLNNLEDEPTGWHRHPKSGRRRTDGDPATEHINM